MNPKKKTEITNKFTENDDSDDRSGYAFYGTPSVKLINASLLAMKERYNLSLNGISDGYHTFGELYDHRCTLYLTLCKALKRLTRDMTGYNTYIWKSLCHHDGSGFEGWFILGIDIIPGKQISYHLPMRMWDEAEFAYTTDKAPIWDGHNSSDVLRRLELLISNWL